MIFVTLLLSVLIFSSWAVLQFLIAPASELLPFLWPLHLVLYAAAFVALAQTIYSRVRQSKTKGAERKQPKWIGIFLFPFVGMHSFLFVALILEVLLAYFIPFYQASLISVAAAYLLAIASFLVARLGPKLAKVSLGQDFKILQISDLHIGATLGQSYVKKVVDISLAAQPDCIMLTGDIGDGDPNAHEESLQELTRLKAPLGIFLILGNHELYWPTNQWIEFFRKAGMTVLIDEEKQLNWKEKNISILGLSPDNRKTVEELAPSKNNLIVLAHYPHRAEEAALAGAKLFLAGHTHGGQFWPWSMLIGLFHRYAIGLYKIKDCAVYVSAGTGYWGPPFRLGRRAEVTLLEIGLS